MMIYEQIAGAMYGGTLRLSRTGGLPPPYVPRQLVIYEQIAGTMYGGSITTSLFKIAKSIGSLYLPSKQ